MSLAKYKQKRNFKSTPEPGAVKGKGSRGLQFVVQRHEASHLHYDLRLEMEGVLKSWAVPKGPSLVAGEKRLAVMVEDHPLAYGKFYGVIPEGNYGAGNVDIWDHGTYYPLKATAKTAEQQLLSDLKKGDLKFVLKGRQLNGAFALVRMNDGEGKNWLLIKKKDEHAVKTYNIENHHSLKTKKRKRAVKVKKAKQATAKDKPARKKEGDSVEAIWHKVNKPMLAKLVDTVTNNSDWLYEPKYDGYRAITKISSGNVEMLSRNGKSFTKAYAPLAEELKKIEPEIILDGEVVIEDKKGVSKFQLLQNYTATQAGVLQYYVFDILFLNGHTVTALPLYQRKELLDSFFKAYKFHHIHNVPVTVTNGEGLLRRLSTKGFEGIIAKNKNSSYLPGTRSEVWYKIKQFKMQEAVICGFTLPQRSRKYFGSLLLGMYSEGVLKYVGNCGTGFTEASLEELHTRFTKLTSSVCPFTAVPKLTGMKGKPVWLKPVLVCNVKFLEWTSDNRLRNPVFMGLRSDKKAVQVIKEVTMKTKSKKSTGSNNHSQEITVGGKKVKITNTSKLYWPEDNITKGDLIDYYRGISKYILPYLKNRPLSLNRHPNGIARPGFYQKDMDVDQLPAWAKTASLYSKSNKAHINYLLSNDEASLIYLANLGCIEINPWHSLYSKPDRPSYLVLDLDPGDIDFKAVVDTALAAKKICDKASVKCHCKTSGATGLHVYIPLGNKYEDDTVKIFAELLAGLVHDALPDITSIERSVSKRKNKVYVDFLQNRKGQTIAAAYSVRPKPGATVSTPLHWNEVNHKLKPGMFTIFNMKQRLETVGDLWKPVLGRGINIKAALKKLGE